MAELQQAMDVWSSTGARYAVPRHFALLGEMCLRSGELAAAEQALDSALSAARSSGERFWEPETHRLIGDLHVRRARTCVGPAREHMLAAAGRALDRSLEVARQQGARSLELRALVSLCQWAELRGETAGPRRLLGELCEQFDDNERDHADWLAAASWLHGH
jgi:predicted ATPase